MNLLINEGFRPEIDSDGDIRFKYEGGIYYILNTNDDGYFQVVFLGFWKIDRGAELGAAMLAASNANRRTKVAKLWADSDFNRMNASAEIFFSDWSDLTGPIITRCLRAIRTAVDTFREEFAKLL